MRKIVLTLVSAALVSLGLSAQQTIDLSGEWGFQTDPQETGIAAKAFQKPLADQILLPGSMPQRLKGDIVTANTEWTGSIYDSTYYRSPSMAKYRREGNVKFPFFLTPVRYYKGIAWYSRDVKVPSEWKGRRVVLFLERAHIQTTLWVDGKRVGSEASLNTPHEYDITAYVKPGSTHHLAIAIDNTLRPEYNPGKDSHSVSDQTQGNWNGIVGKIELRSTPKAYFSDIQIYPDIHAKTAEVKMKIRSAKALSGKVTLSAEAYNTAASHRVSPVTASVAVKAGETECSMTLPMGDGMLLWDEFTPNLYKLTAELSTSAGKDEQQVRFGMREFSIEGKYFYVNGRKTLLRGTVENCCFPDTGYAPMDLDSWLRVFEICRAYGLNHMRYHSYCPPEAAFEAADMIGFYLQPEGPAWANHGVKLGEGEPVDDYLMRETSRMEHYYGNSPSYCLLSSGNEPAGNFMAWENAFVEHWIARDPRRVYTGSTGWGAGGQYTISFARGLTWKSQRPESLTDYARNVAFSRGPFLSHETGQWCVFPDFNEIRKYTGVNKALNFEIFKEILEENDLGERGHDFYMASGKLQALMYKHELEKHLRTDGYAGFQLLSLNDYSGQGSALVGVTDVFFDPKEYISVDEWRRFCNTTVPLARMEKFVFTSADTLRAEMQAAHFGAEPLRGVEVTYKITNQYRTVVASGSLGKKDLEIGNCQPLGLITWPLAGITKAGKYNLEVALAGTEFVNDWDFWVYPAEVEPQVGDVLVKETLDQEAEEVLRKGGKVLLLAAGKITYGDEIKQSFTPVFWNTSWFKMKAPHTTGIWLNDRHPVFKSFPTDYHSDIQWWELINNAQPMLMADFPQGFVPLVYTIDTWFLSRKCGMMFEANVLGGKILVTSMDLTSHPDTRIVARQLYASVLDYMNSDAFRPESRLEPGTIRDLYTKVAGAVDMGTKDAPDELKNPSRVQQQ